MKKNKIAIIAVVILGSLAFWFIITDKRGTIKETLRDFAVQDTASIDKIFLADKKGRTITLERKSPAKWIVNGKYDVRPDVIQTLLYTIRKVDIKEPVGKKAQNNVIKRLAATAVKCEIFSKGELIKAYYVGSETQDLTGTYMILIDLKTMEPSAKPFVTYIPGFEGYLTTRYFTEEIGWRDRTVFSYIPNEIKSVRMEVPHNPEYGYEVVALDKNLFDVKMVNTGKSISNIDTLAIKQYLSYFKQLNFESFEVEMTSQEMDSVKKSKPINIITVTNKEGKINQVKFFPRKPKQGHTEIDGKKIEFDQERMSAVLDNGQDFVFVQYYNFGKVMPPADYFQKK